MTSSPAAKARTAVTVLCLLSPLAASARQGAPPASLAADLAPLSEVPQLVLPPIDPDALLKEDGDVGAGPLRYASVARVVATPETDGRWEDLADGSALWRLRVFAPASTDLNFGFRRFRLPDGASLHVTAEDGGYYEGPYTAEDNEEHGELWTPVVPGDRAVLELRLPAGAPAAELELSVVGRGYRDLFGRYGASDPAGSGGGLPKSGACNNDVVCPEGDPWRDEIASVAVYSTGASLFCTGQMIADVPGTFRNWFLTASHCGIRTGNAPSLVVYWNYEASTCGGPRDGSLAQNQTGATFRANEPASDFCLVELDDDPDPAWNVYHAGWDASGAIAQGSVGIHHPSTDEKAISFNVDPLVPDGASCLGIGWGEHWQVTEWEDGTTEGGSSGSGLWDPDTHLIVGFLSGGAAACRFPDAYDCYGRFDIAWSSGGSPATRLRDWLDPNGTGALQAPGSPRQAALRYVGHVGADSCALGAGDANSIWEPGETIVLPVTVAAGGDHAAISGTLRSLTPGVSVTRNTATWPDLSNGRQAETEPPHFEVQLDQTPACFSPIRLELELTSDQGGPWIATIDEEVGRPTRAEQNVLIPDPGSAGSDLTVPDAVVLTDVDVHVQISHSWVGDLTLRLRSPSGREVLLLARPGEPADQFGCRDDDMDVTFDDDAAMPLEDHCDGTDPWYAGRAQPVEPLAVLAGESATGTWTLTVEDAALGDPGSIVTWELITQPPISAGACLACTEGGCEGRVMAESDLRLAKAGARGVVRFPGPSSPCAEGVAVLVGTTARPAPGPLDFPGVNPVFGVLQRPAAPPELVHDWPPGDAYYLVVEALPGNGLGPAGHYGR